jgi:hypothetical protein
MSEPLIIPRREDDRPPEMEEMQPLSRCEAFTIYGLFVIFAMIFVILTLVTTYWGRVAAVHVDHVHHRRPL